MTVIAIGVILLAFREFLVRRSGRKLGDLFTWIIPSTGLAHLAVITLPFLYVAQIAILDRQVFRDNTHERYAWMKTLPVPIFDGRNGSADYDAFVSATSFSVGLLETFAIAIVALALRNGAAMSKQVVVLSCAGLAIISLVAPVMSTSDPYEYVASGILGFVSYAPPHGVFDRSIYAGINTHIPLRGVIYGPLWLIVDTLQTSLGSSVYAKIEALRFTNTMFIYAFLRILACAGTPRPALITIAINPVLWNYSVASPHADIQGLVLLALALHFARLSKPLLAATAIVLAGLIKLPFVIIGGVALYAIDGPRRRILFWIGAMVLVGVLSYTVPGGSYVRDLSSYAVARAASNRTHLWIAASLIAIVATATFVASRKGYLSFALLFHQAGPIAAPWYLYWGIPYALAIGSSELYFAAMPLAATMLDDTLKTDILAKCLLIVGLSLVVEYAALRNRVASRESTPAEELHLVTMEP